MCQTSTPSWTALTRQVALAVQETTPLSLPLLLPLLPLLLVLCALLVFVASAEICCCHCACPSVRSSCPPGGSSGVCSTACVCVQRSRPGERQACPKGRQTSCETTPTQLAAHKLPTTRSFQRDDDHTANARARITSPQSAQQLFLVAQPFWGPSCRVWPAISLYARSSPFNKEQTAAVHSLRWCLTRMRPAIACGCQSTKFV